MNTPPIPTVLDRVIQQAIAQILTPIYDPTFSENSHGFRPGRSAHDAIRAVQMKSNTERRKWVVDCDLKAFFDTVNHDVLMNRLRRRVRDKRVLSLIGKYLLAGVVLPDRKFEPTGSGVPQGGPLSPLLANILLDDLDQEMEKRGHSFARYADDFVILCRSQRAATRILRSITTYIEQSLKLVVNQTKSKVCEINQAAFLGFTIVKGRVKWAVKSKNKFNARLKEPERSGDRLPKAARKGEQSESNYQADARGLPEQSDGRASVICAGCGELLRARGHLPRSPGLGWMVAPTRAPLLLETMGEATCKEAQPDPSGDQSRQGAYG